MHSRRECRDRTRGSEGHIIQVVEHDERRLAPEFEKHLLDGGGGIGHHRTSGGRRAGERDHVHAGICRQLCADSMVAGRDDIDDTRWKIGVFSDDSPQYRRTPWGIRGRFENEGVTRRKCRAHLGEIDLMRKIPRSHRADHANRLTRQGAPGFDAHG
ncbi:Uncharacterised protein [Mycobacteroides abscessus subsp. massiliense]|nr:Uncharacterised protein [Mycobacteroides abscessus subsp. massiliense]